MVTGNAGDFEESARRILAEYSLSFGDAAPLASRPLLPSVIGTKIGPGKPVVGATLVVALLRSTPIFISGGEGDNPHEIFRA